MINEKKCSLCCTKIEHFSVKKGSKAILSDINLHIHCGELTVIVGPNGAGKSTLFKAIIGETAHEGHLLYHDEKSMHIKPNIGYVPQSIMFDSSTPASVLDLYAAGHQNSPVWCCISKKTRKKALEALEKFDVSYTLDRKLGTLSGGELQRVFLALAIDRVPDILLLDEPVSGVDLRGLDTFYNTVSDLRKKYDMTIILISHDLPLIAKYADRAIYLNKRVIAEGTPKEVYSNSEFIKAFGEINI